MQIIEIPTIYEDEYILAVNKPYGIASVPGPYIKHDVVQLLDRQGVFVLHRLDVKTSGVLLLGKKRRSREVLESILNGSDTHKKYIAVVKGIPEPVRGVINKKVPARNKDIFVEAHTKYVVLNKLENVSLVEAEIATGRRHQIRIHFAEINHPVVNDTEYGDFGWNKKFQRKYKVKRMLLHAASISFTHPFLNTQITITAPAPEYFAQFMPVDS